MTKKLCPKCKSPMEHDDGEITPPYKHYICDSCDLFWCFDNKCHCCDGLEED